MFNLKSNMKSADKSIPKERVVHGIIIKKQPIGAYITAMNALQELPKALLNDLFPDKSATEILALFTHLTNDNLADLLGKTILVLPERLIDLLCPIIQIDAQFVKDNITPNEFIDIVMAFWEVNDLTDFFKRVSGLIKAKMPALLNGFKNGLQ